MMGRVLCSVAMMAMLAPAAQAQSAKEKDCLYQGQVVAAIQQARLERVREAKVIEHVSGAGDWPARYDNSIPIFAGWIYGSEVKMKDLREQNFGEAWRQTCLSQ
ncbi:MAG: hypothetical protein P1U53_04545 [Sulfitobacter sp.]|nr:hypothetical protein [Sulfitobacter sp.]